MPGRTCDVRTLKRSLRLGTAFVTGANQRNWCVALRRSGTRKIYWTQKGPDNAGGVALFRASLEIAEGESAANRTDIEVLFAGLPEPIDLDLRLNNRMIYWTDRGNPPRGNTVSRAPIDTESKDGQGTGKFASAGLMEESDCLSTWKAAGFFLPTSQFGIFATKLDGSEKKPYSCPGELDWRRICERFFSGLAPLLRLIANTQGNSCLMTLE